VRFKGDDDAVAQLSGALVREGALIHALAPETATLEDLFFSLTEGSPADVDHGAEPAAQLVGEAA
jgi:hypothetical protein